MILPVRGKEELISQTPLKQLILTQTTKHTPIPPHVLSVKMRREKAKFRCSGSDHDMWNWEYL